VLEVVGAALAARADGEYGVAAQRAENGRTLAHLVEVLSPSVVRVLATRGLDRVIAREIVVYDVAEPPSLRSGDVLLGTAVVATSDEACRIAREAAAAGRSVRRPDP